MIKFEYETTQYIYDYIIENFKLGDFLFVHKMISIHKDKMSESAIRKAVSDIKKAGILKSTIRGGYIVTPNPNNVNLIQLMKNLEDRFGNPTDFLIKSDSSWLSNISGFTTQMTNSRRIIILKKGKNTKEKKEWLNWVINICLPPEESISNIYDSESLDDIRTIISSYFIISHDFVSFEKYVESFNNEYSDFVKIVNINNVNNKESAFRKRTGLLTLLYGSVPKVIYEYLENLKDEYIVYYQRNDLDIFNI